MTRPDPLGVECPTCEALPREGCRAADMPWPGPRVKPHAARIKTAEQARRQAEEALAHHATCPGGGKWRECSSSLASALRALLAALPAEPVLVPCDGKGETYDKVWSDRERLMGLIQGWYEGRARIGAHMTFVDQRFYDSARRERTGWPGDDADGDGGPPEE